MTETTAPPRAGAPTTWTLDDYHGGRCALADLLKPLPMETSREYELLLMGIALKADRARLRPELLVAVRDADEDVAFAAFYCGTILLRRMKDFTELESWFMIYGPRFAGRPAYGHTRVMSDLERGLRNVDVSQTLRLSRGYAQGFPKHTGFVHLYADVVATARELARENGDEQPPVDAIESGLKAVDDAIALEPGYAKFYATKARLLALRHDYGEALICITFAIDREDSSRSDYAIRIGNYQSLRLSIQSQENDRKLRNRIEEYSREFDRKHDEAEAKLAESVSRMDGSTLKNLEFLGFFAALISFTIGSVQMAVSFPPQDAAGLIVVLMGALLVAFSGFSFILERHLSTSSWRVLIAGGVGLLACVGGALIWLR
ncbi:hypothetical protein [Paeniglutamicibacter cryotolerans]|uniref:Tetratricopeptide repeat protein n=1 Tax=Paeniglutamicibacter cryotolerans TaxID=670079 RepID=A0A839QKA4_9MICC|nr:hypothetical protein [Paeniglutamicibacter cryotolerans]MBB2996260.1 hypothetical protein [Paeniglutamicibacter cryotolerans]